MCRAGYGEVEIHLHHDHDTAEGLRLKLLEFKKTLAERHGLELIDVQVLTPHTVRMGAVEIPRERYMERLELALARKVDWRGMER